MLWLTSTSSLIKVVTGSALNVDVHASFVDRDGATTPATITPGNANTPITTATTSNVVGSPSGTNKRNIKHLSIVNKDASSADVVTVQHFDGSNAVQLWKGSLPAGWMLSYNDRLGWRLNDQTGRDL